VLTNPENMLNDGKVYIDGNCINWLWWRS